MGFHPSRVRFLYPTPRRYTPPPPFPPPGGHPMPSPFAPHPRFISWGCPRLQQRTPLSNGLPVFIFDPEGCGPHPYRPRVRTDTLRRREGVLTTRPQRPSPTRRNLPLPCQGPSTPFRLTTTRRPSQLGVGSTHSPRQTGRKRFLVRQTPLLSPREAESTSGSPPGQWWVGRVTVGDHDRAGYRDSGVGPGTLWSSETSQTLSHRYGRTPGR